jgi:DNA polymerase-3 subunit delta'
MLFRDILGQEDIKSYLREIVNQDRIPHAMLFFGKSGTGSLPMALAFGQFLMCENRYEGDACGDCNHCKKSAKWIHPDIHYTYPTIGTKSTSVDFTSQWRSFLETNAYGDVFEWLNVLGGDNKQGNITKDECNRILKVLSLKTFEGEYKIQILWMPEFLGTQGNRLLKIIEEPPDNTVFILVAERQEDILNTLVSRCQLVNFRPIPDQLIGEFLEEKADLNQNQALQIAFLSDGNLNEAYKLIGQKEELLAHTWIEWMRKMYKGNAVEMVDLSSQFNQLDRESQKNILRYGLHFSHEMLIFHLNPHYVPRLLDKESSALRKLSALVSVDQIEHMIEIINTSIFHLERNANSKILMLDDAIQIHHILRNTYAVGGSRKHEFAFTK